MRNAVIAAVVLFLTAPATAQPAEAPAPCQDDIYRAFDFWIGEWDVSSGGKPAGENIISVREGGCLLLEEWTSADGTTGQSYNFYDPGAGKWRQLWVSGGSVIDYAGGLDANGAMVLEGTIAYRNGATAPFKGAWTLQEDGAVIQHFQQYDAESESWRDWFIGRYTKKTSTP